MSTVPSIALNDGNTIPQLGFGVFQIKPAETAAAVRSALEVGYRHIDTAEMYGNEKEVAQGIRDAGLERGEVFIMSKLNNGFHRPDDARRAFDATLAAARDVAIGAGGDEHPSADRDIPAAGIQTSRIPG